MKVRRRRAAFGSWSLAFVLSLTAPATWFFARILTSEGFDSARVLLIGIFALLYAWICSWVLLSITGTWRLWRTRSIMNDDASSSRGQDSPISLSTTAVVLPVYNEDPDAVFGRVHAMLESIAATGAAHQFEFFVLSDSRNPDTWLREECCWAELRAARKEFPIVYYRRRPYNFRRKTGNLADFCERWGRRYRYMIVLDADSIMNGATMLELVRRMDAAPRLGILQVPCLPALSRSIYARAQQFAASVYGPPLYAGLSFWLQENGVYWGHNAIIRIEPFMEYCGLPALPGRPPFGGPILSHDFVEAAFMQRAGYSVRLAWDIVAGSYEQCPASVSAAAARDRRWCQGNLQHLPLVLSNTFSIKSRVHFLTGALSYLMSVLWCLFVVLYLTNVSRHLDTCRHLLPLVPLTLVLLLLPKACGLLWAQMNSERAALHGGRLKLLLSSVVETIITSLLAPLVMLAHVACVVSSLFGSRVDWTPAHRGDATSPWADAIKKYTWQSALGLILAFAAFHRNPYTAVWLSPVWMPLMFAVPIAAATASHRLGDWLRECGLLLAPSEVHTDSVLRRTLDLVGERRARDVASMSAEDCFWKVVCDPWLNALHVTLLQTVETRSRPRSAIEPLLDRVRADGFAALATSEVLTLLSDIWAMQLLQEVALADGIERPSDVSTQRHG